MDGQRTNQAINWYEAELAELRDRGSSISKERRATKGNDILKETLESEESANQLRVK